jgi:hypothetical protein
LPRASNVTASTVCTPHAGRRALIGFGRSSWFPTEACKEFVGRVVIRLAGVTVAVARVIGVGSG